MRRLRLALLAIGLALLVPAMSAQGQRRAAPVPPRPPALDSDAAIRDSWPEARLPEPRAVWRARLEPDPIQRLCSQYRNRPPRRVASAIQKLARASLQYPADGIMLGDWRRGEAIAQSGYGQRFTDTTAGRPNGGNCYGCHQLSPTEISHGTLGPSLTGYGRLHDYSAEAARKVYDQIYNSHARTPCSNMPRFGAGGTLTIEQIKDLVALLMAPDSPVNTQAGAPVTK